MALNWLQVCGFGSGDESRSALDVLSTGGNNNRSTQEQKAVTKRAEKKTVTVFNRDGFISMSLL